METKIHADSQILHKRGDEERNSGGPRRKLKATYTLRTRQKQSNLCLLPSSKFSVLTLNPVALPEDGMPEICHRELGSAEKEKWGVENETGGERIVPW
ncbi:hypothetical protein JHK85_038571 [Glycine max]|nr:hypothetical protein JHK85_038571 [Glycine max]